MSKIIPLNPKVKATAGSSNFFVALISIVILSFQAQGFEINVEADNVWELVNSKDWINLGVLILMNFFQPVLKLISKDTEWSWKEILGSKNFITQAVTVFLSLLTLVLGVAFAPEAPAEIAAAIEDGSFAAIVTALSIHVLNVLYHFFFDNEETSGNQNEGLKKAA